MDRKREEHWHGVFTSIQMAIAVASPWNGYTWKMVWEALHELRHEDKVQLVDYYGVKLWRFTGVESLVRVQDVSGANKSLVRI